MTLGPPDADAVRVVVQGARIFDGDADLGVGTVVLRGASVEAVLPGEGVTPTAEDEVVDGSGCTLLPGLIDGHVHVYPGALEQALAFGVTTEVDLFSHPPTTRALRDRARAGAGSDVLTAGTGASAPGGHPSQLVSVGILPAFPTLERPEEAEAFVDERLDEGSELVKIIVEDGAVSSFPQRPLSPETIRAVVEAAHRRGVLAVAHATSLPSAVVAVEAGVDGLVHWCLDGEPTSALVERMRRGEVFVVPTLTLLEALSGPPGSAELLERPGWAKRLTEAGRAQLSMRFPAYPGTSRHGHDLASAIRGVGTLHAAGIRIVAGTDAGNPGCGHGVSLHRELELLVLAGLRPHEALAAATSQAATAYRMPDRGRLAAGLRADVLMVRGTPSRSVTDTRELQQVWCGGRPLDLRP